MDNCYIVKQNSGMSCFYYEQGVGIVSKKFENNKWSVKNTIISSTKSLFSVSVDEKGDIYIFCQDNFGNIIVSTNSSGDFVNKIILENKTDRIYTVVIHPIITSEGISIVYNMPNLEDKSNHMVIQMLKQGGQWSNPKKIDKFYPVGQKLFSINHVTQNHLLLFYQMKMPENVLGYREITQNNQGNFNVIHKTSYQITDASFLTSETTIYVVYIIKTMFSYQLIFKKKDSENFTQPILIWESQKIENCLMFFVSEKLYVTYIYNSSLYFSVSQDLGNTFSKPQRYRNKFCLNPVKANLITSSKKDIGKFLADEIYVDSASLWDIQLLPDLYDDFYSVEQQKEEKIKSQNINEEPRTAKNETFDNRDLVGHDPFFGVNNDMDKRILTLSQTVKEQKKEISQLEREKEMLSRQIIEMRNKYDSIGQKKEVEEVEEVED